MTLLAPSVVGRVGLHIARYRDEGCTDPGRGTITWDGVEVAAFDAAAYWNAHHPLRRERTQAGEPFAIAYDGAQAELEAAGNLGFWRFEQALEAYPDLAFDAALTHESPIIRGLAMLDRRLGRRRRDGLAHADDLPFIRRLYELRVGAEVSI